jgi:hypothetical protein
MDLYVRVTNALKAIDIIQDAARDAEKDLRVAKKQINYRMDEWMRRYEDEFASVTDRKVDQAKYESYNDGFDEGEKKGRSDGERDALKKFQADTKKKNERLSKMYMDEFGIEILGEPRLISKTLIHVGEPHSNVTTRTYELGNPRQKELEHLYLPPQNPSHFHHVTEVLDPEDEYSAKITKAVPISNVRFKEPGHVTGHIRSGENRKPSVVMQSHLPTGPLYAAHSDQRVTGVHKVPRSEHQVGIHSASHVSGSRVLDHAPYISDVHVKRLAPYKSGEREFHIAPQVTEVRDVHEVRSPNPANLTHPMHEVSHSANPVREMHKVNSAHPVHEVREASHSAHPVHEVHEVNYAHPAHPSSPMNEVREVSHSAHPVHEVHEVPHSTHQVGGVHEIHPAQGVSKAMPIHSVLGVSPSHEINHHTVSKPVSRPISNSSPARASPFDTIKRVA